MNHMAANENPVTAPTLNAIPKIKSKSSYKRKLTLYGVLFALPWMLGILIFSAYPLVMSIYYSFTSYSASWTRGNGSGSGITRN